MSTLQERVLRPLALIRECIPQHTIRRLWIDRLLEVEPVVCRDEEVLDVFGVHVIVEDDEISILHRKSTEATNNGA